MTNLTAFWDDWLSEQGENSEYCLSRLQQDFDTVSHNILIHKLVKSGLGKDSEMDVKPAEVITGSRSCSLGLVPSGAPQGLILGQQRCITS